VHAARSNNEKRERFLQSINALFLFFYAPKLAGLLWNKPFLKAAGKPQLWAAEFKNSIRQNMHPGENFSDKFKSKIANLKYSDIEKYFQGSVEQKRQLVRLKHGKFAISGLGIPISTLSLVQLINFRLTEQKIKRQQPGSFPIPPQTSHQPKNPAAGPGIQFNAAKSTAITQTHAFMNQSAMPVSPFVHPSSFPAGIQNNA
jgi:hypothetical protein